MTHDDKTMLALAVERKTKRHCRAARLHQRLSLTSVAKRVIIAIEMS
jgi:hypothetical protein